MVPHWMMQIVDWAFGHYYPEHLPFTANVTFVNSSVDLWNTFVESSAVQTLVSDNDTCPKPLEQWQEQLLIAYRLCRDMDLEDKLNLPTILPVLSRLIVGTYACQRHCHLDKNNLNDYLLHAIITIRLSTSPPICIFHWIVQHCPEQLQIADPIHKQLPLAAACQYSHCPDTVLTLLYAHPPAASIADNQGRHALYLACCNPTLTWGSCLWHLFQAAPEVLRQSAVNGQCLLVSTAVAQQQNTTIERQRAEHVHTLYQLLRNDPTVLLEFIE